MNRLPALTLVGTLVVAAALRLPGVPFGLPLFTHPDETFIVTPALRMLEQGDPNPHWFEYPSLLMYLNSGLYAAGARLTGAPAAAEVDPARLRTWARTMTVLFALAAVAATCAAAALAFGPLAGVAAAALLAVLPLHVGHSFFVTADVPASFATALALWASVSIVVRGATPRRHLLAGAAVGLAAGMKYTAVYVATSVVVAHWLACGLRPRVLWRSGAVAGALVAAVVFFATTPYAILDYEAFSATLSWQNEHFSGGHVGAEAVGTRSYPMYGRWLRDLLGFPGSVLALFGLAVAAWTRPRETAVVCVFPLVFLLLMGSYRVAFERYLVALLPALAVAASGSTLLVSRLPARAAAAGTLALGLWWGPSSSKRRGPHETWWSRRRGSTRGCSRRPGCVKAFRRAPGWRGRTTRPA